MDTLRWSWRLWAAAIGFGLLETALVVAQGDQPGIVTGVGLRLVVFAVAAMLVLALRGGSRAARIALAVLLGGLGSLSLLIGPVEWFAEGRGVVGFLRAADGWDLAFAVSRVLHVAAVWAATVLMFTPSANARMRRAAKPGVAMPGRTGRTT